MKTNLIKRKTRDKGRTTIAVLGEGLTEYLYFQGMKEYEKYQFKGEKLRFYPDKPSKGGRKCTDILEEAMGFIKHTDFVFCILDNDTIENCQQNKTNYEISINKLKVTCSNIDEEINVYEFPENLSKTKLKLKNKAVIILKSMPCLEFWYFLHFDDKNRLYKECGKVTKLLKDKKYIVDYTKNQEYYKQSKIYANLRDKLSIAIGNAEKINNLRIREPDRKCSFSDLYFLFQFLGIGLE